MGIEKQELLTQSGNANFTEVELLTFDLPQDGVIHNTEQGAIAVASRRKHTRHPARWLAVATLADKTSVPCRLENISVSGALINSSVRVKAGQRAHLKMDSYVFGVRKMIDAVVEFKHVSLCDDQYRIGCEFIKVSEASKRFIALYVQKKNPHARPEPVGNVDLCPA